MSSPPSGVAPLVPTAPLRRDARIIGLLFASTTSMIGSGWLFGAFHAARIAGPLAVWSWIVGAVIIMLIALCFAELSSMFPKSGALVHMSHASHGDGLGRIWGWMLFLAYVPVPAVETEAVVTYANNYVPGLIVPGGTGVLTGLGFVVCAILLLIMAALNLMAIRLLLQVNSTVTWWKIAVPVVTALTLIFASMGHPSAMSADPGGYSATGIFLALPAAGIVFSFLGFRTAIDLGGESANPGRNIPLAVIGSVLLGAVVYILLQIGFLAALTPKDLAHGWAHLNFPGAMGPFAGLAAMMGLGWLAFILYVDAYVSPGGTGLMYVTGGSRILYAMGEMRAGPTWLTLLNGAKVPWLAVAVMWVVGVIFLLPFPAWQLLVNYITSITVLTYGLGPIALLVLRRNVPQVKRPFLLPAANVIAPAAFVCSNLIVLWTGFLTNTVLMVIVVVGFAAYAGWFHLISRRSAAEFGWREIFWLLPWFGGIWVISALSNVGGGLGILTFWPAVIVTVIWSLVVVAIALRCALVAEDTAAVMAHMSDIGMTKDLI
ncbi:MAG TPA: APC family permease [Acidisoma sp.]|uniref:APC family permease n=1 Tax=Acidisoma sp. TaxID=1872115 RepID=UPI002BA83CA2|nr:APC family permease [Acidisoma sp.]HTI01464.1 APC family permease [Acidisoma sp.]